MFRVQIGEHWPTGSGEKIYWNIIEIFCYFRIISLSKDTAFKKMTFFYPIIFNAKFGWNLNSGSEDENVTIWLYRRQRRQQWEKKYSDQFRRGRRRTTNSLLCRWAEKKLCTWLISLDHISKVLVVLNKHVNMWLPQTGPSYASFHKTIFSFWRWHQ